MLLTEIGVGAFLARPSNNDGSKTGLDSIACQRFVNGLNMDNSITPRLLAFAHWQPYSFEKQFTASTTNLRKRSSFDDQLVVPTAPYGN